MNSTIVAAQVTWPLQAAVAATFLAALGGLAWLLGRPGARVLSIGWGWTVLALLIAAFSALSGNRFATRSIPVIQAMIAAAVAASAPAFIVAMDVVLDPRAVPQRPAIVRQTLLWVIPAFASVLTAGHLVPQPESIETSFTLVVARVALMVVYALLASHAIRRAKSAPESFRLVLMVLSAAFALQVLRPVSAAFVFGEATQEPLANPRALAFVVVNLLITTVLGLACMLLALAEERDTVAAASRRLREAAVAMERAQRLESVGRLASGVAHDFNNFLAVIKGGAEVARYRFADGQMPSEELEAIDDAANRGAALTRQLLTFARQQPREATAMDAVQRVRDMSVLLDRMVGRQIGTSYQLNDQPITVHMDPSQFEQLLLNLVVNAKNAIAGSGGRIAIKVSRATLSGERLVDGGELQAGDYAVLSVTDNGSGIAPDVMPSIFEPFFTTRSDAGGTGLGLATVLGIARQSGGTVRVESTLGSGTTFTVLLPVLSL